MNDALGWETAAAFLFGALASVLAGYSGNEECYIS